MTLKLVDEKYPQWINEIEAADLPLAFTLASPLSAAQRIEEGSNFFGVRGGQYHVKLNVACTA